MNAGALFVCCLLFVIVAGRLCKAAGVSQHSHEFFWQIRHLMWTLLGTMRIHSTREIRNTSLDWHFGHFITISPVFLIGCSVKDALDFIGLAEYYYN
jgi:hypothetical protein